MLIFPFNVKASQKFNHTVVAYAETPYRATSVENVAYAPNREVVDGLAEKYQRTRTIVQNKRASYAKRPLQCVEYAKRVVGVFGTWGDGGRKLSLNSTGLVGDVVIFRTIHVAVVIDRVGDVLTITEANYDWKGSIRTRIIDVSDPSIKGFHRF